MAKRKTDDIQEALEEMDPIEDPLMNEETDVADSGSTEEDSPEEVVANTDDVQTDDKEEEASESEADEGEVEDSEPEEVTDVPSDDDVEDAKVDVVSDEEEDSDDESPVEIDRSEGEWFIIQTYSGQEFKVKKSLEHRIGSMNLSDKIFEILIPEEDIIEVKNNKKVERKKKMYPGYIFVRMHFDNDLWYLMKKIPGLSKFMGNQNLPIPVKDEEMLKVLRQVGVKIQKYQIDFEVGDMIKIIAGPFRGYTGPVKDINMEKGKLKSMILIFGRETPVEIDFDQVEKTGK